MKISELSNKQMTDLLLELGLEVTEVSSIEVAGEGNMNCTLRVSHDSGSVIVKQSQDYCEKYPSIPAPIERANIEAQFYNYVYETKEINEYFPKILANNTDKNILVLEDLGKASDYSSVYSGSIIPKEEMKEIASVLLKLHKSVDSDGKELQNINMRKLNHEYIFVQPLQSVDNPSLDQITPGLNEATKFIRENEQFKTKVQELGEVYLKDGKRLLHGDYYPNSWLNVDGKLFIIDPEFGFFGKAEFDFGVLLAHMVLSGQPRENIKTLFDEYQPEFIFVEELAISFAGVEIMRRILGVAQLPLNVDLNQKVNWMHLAKRLVLNPSRNYFEI